MALVTEKPEDIASTNALDEIPDDLLQIAPAYYSLGTTPAPMENPPEIGETRTVLARVKCTGEGKTVRTDGELRYTRKFEIQACWEKGQPEPPDADEQQPGLFDEGEQGEGWDYPDGEAQGGDPE